MPRGGASRVPAAVARGVGIASCGTRAVRPHVRVGLRHRRVHTPRRADAACTRCRTRDLYSPLRIAATSARVGASPLKHTHTQHRRLKTDTRVTHGQVWACVTTGEALGSCVTTGQVWVCVTNGFFGGENVAEL